MTIMCLVIPVFSWYICYLLYVSIYLEDHTWHAMNSSKIILGIKTDPRYLIFFQGKLPHPSKPLGEKIYLKAIGVANSPVSCNSRLGVTSPRFHARDFKFCIIPSTWHTWHAMNSSGIILGLKNLIHVFRDKQSNGEIRVARWSIFPKFG